MIISYAQNFEDVLLWRAVGHIQKGFYIDIGAQHPLIDSVSLAFYEHGWRGIHIEPVSNYAEMLRKARPDETVIEAAVSNRNGKIKYFEIPDTGLSTIDPSIAKKHEAAGFNVNQVIVTSMTLSSILECYTDREIHWLKIDVEGSEDKVLLGWGPSKVRPWIVVIESTLPLTQIASFSNWESLLISYDYSFEHFDGLNRYYVSNSHPELKDAFRAGPNVFDGFTLSGTANSPFCKLIQSRFNDQSQIEKREFDSQIQVLTDRIKNINRAIAVRGHGLASSQAHQEEIDSTPESITSRKGRENEENTQADSELSTLETSLVQRENNVSEQLLQLHNEVKQVRVYLEKEEKVRHEDINKEKLLIGKLQEATTSKHGLEIQLKASQDEMFRLSQIIAVQNETFSQFRKIASEKDIHLVDLKHVIAQRDNEIAILRSEAKRQLQLFLDIQQEMTTCGAEMFALDEYTKTSNASLQMSLKKLLTLLPQEFVTNAYRMLLQREPDEDGLRHHINLLRYGESRIEILRRIRFSSEGKDVSASVPGLRIAFIKQRIYRVPIFGHIIRMAIGLSSLTYKDRRMFETEMTLALEQIKRRHSEFCKSLSRFSEVLGRYRADGSVNISSSNDFAFLNSVDVSSSDNVPILTPYARSIYSDLICAIERRSTRDD